MRKLIWLATFTGWLAVMPLSATLVVNETTTASGGFYNYTYTLSETGTSAAYTDFLLNTADLSPTHVTLNFDGGGAGLWTWLDYSTTKIDFFNNGSASLNLGDTLVISFLSNLAPGTQTLQGFNNNTGAGSNIVASVAPAAAPEPTTFAFMAIGSGLCALTVLRRRLASCV